jgi:hypothetical protein
MFLGSKARSVRNADKHTVICEPIVCRMWYPQHLTTLQASTACNENSFTLLFNYYGFVTNNSITETQMVG